MLSADASALLARAQHAEHAVDLYLAPGATRLVADRLVEIMHRAPVEALTARALWNTLFAAGELSLRVDVYRAHDLFRAATALVTRVASCGWPPGDPRAVAAEMAFDFFFARTEHPLLPLRGREVLASLSALLAGERLAARAALHGISHVVELARGVGLAAFASDASAVVDEYTHAHSPAALDPALLELAELARAGAMR